MLARRGTSSRTASISSGGRAPTPESRGGLVDEARSRSPELGRGAPITPNSANRSREELRRFVSQAQSVSSQVVPSAYAVPNLPSSSSSSTTSSSHRPAGHPDRPRSRLSDRDRDRRSQSSSFQESSSPPAYPNGSSSSSSTSNFRDPPSRILSQSKSSATLRESGRGNRTSDSNHNPFPPEPSPPILPTSRSTSSLARHNERTRSPPPPPRDYDDPVPVPTTPVDFYFNVQPSPATPPPVTVRPPSTQSVQSLEEPFTPTIEVNQSARQIESFEALKSSESLSRRASKRYSAYAIQKITSGGAGSPSGRVGDLRSETGGSSPFSAGRELSSRGSEEQRRAGPARRAKSEFRRLDGERRVPPPMPSIPSSHNNEREQGFRPLTMVEEEFFSPLLKDPNLLNLSGIAPASPSPSLFSSSSSSSAPPSPTQHHTSSVSMEKAHSTTSTSSVVSATSSAPLPATASSSEGTTPQPSSTPLPTEISVNTASSPPEAARTSVTASDPEEHEPEFPMSVYLQIGRDVKKVRLEERPSVAALRVLFIERFQYNPGHADFPNIYLRDPIVGVQYELEDMAEVKNGSVISLNIDSEFWHLSFTMILLFAHSLVAAVEQVKQHIDQGLLTLTQEIKELRSTVASMRRASVTTATFSPDVQFHTSPMMSRPSERQFQDAAQKVLKIKRPEQPEEVAPSTAPAPAPAPPVQVNRPTAAPEPSTPISPTSSVTADARSAQVVGVLKTQHEEVQNLRREIGVLRQIYSDFANQTKSMLANVRTQTSHVQTLAATKVSTARAFIDAGKVKLESETTELIERGDRVQDAIDDMRVDISVKKIRPRPGQISEIAAQLQAITKTRDELTAWVANVKPSWKATWSDELETIISEQKLLEAQEGLLSELQVDLQEAAGVFATIQDVIKQPPRIRRPTREFKPMPSEGGGGLDTVMLEVRTLTPDVDRRLEAIARAEKAREIELASRTDEFADELGGFVAGNKLKKSGGIEETERLRQARTEASLKAMFKVEPPPLPGAAGGRSS